MKVQNPSMVRQIIPAYPKEQRTISRDEPFLNVAEFFRQTVQGEGVNIGVPSAFLRLQNCTLNCMWCFHENTKIQTLNSPPKKIKDIKEGDVLLTLDENKGIVQTTVKRTMNRQANIAKDMIQIKASAGPLYVTKEHPIFIKEKGWTPAHLLKKGDIILSVTGKQIVSYKMKTKNPMKQEQTRNKMSATVKTLHDNGAIIPYERTEKHKRMQSALKIGDKNPMKKHATRRKNTLSHQYPVSTLEKKFMELFLQNNLPVSFTNTKLAIGNDREGYHFPDFVIDGKLKIIEVYDSSFPLYADGVRTPDNYEFPLVTHYEKFGYKILFLTQEDLSEAGLQKVIEFAFNGSIIESISCSFTKKEYAALFGSTKEKQTTVYNLECFPYNSYLANNMLVHNCDTEEVWRQGNPYTFTELFDLIEKSGLMDDLISGHHLILTGGSPLKQQEALFSFLEIFGIRYGFMPYIEIENECTLMPGGIEHYIQCWNNSPKLENSGNPKQLRYQPAVLRELSSYKNSWFKFVIEGHEDEWKEIEKDFINPGYIKYDQVIFMPMGGEINELENNRVRVAEMAIRKGVRFTDRLHVTLWNTLTGV